MFSTIFAMIAVPEENHEDDVDDASAGFDPPTNETTGLLRELVR